MRRVKLFILSFSLREFCRVVGDCRQPRALLNIPPWPLTVGCDYRMWFCELRACHHARMRERIPEGARYCRFRGRPAPVGRVSGR